MPDDVDARVVPIDGAWNFRDAGGLLTTTGSRIKRRVFYRSDALHELTPAGRAALATLKLRTVCDLRMPNERKGKLDRLPVDGSVRSISLPLCLVPGMDPTAAQRVWGLLSGKFQLKDVEQIVSGSYLHMIRTQARQLGRIVALLGVSDNLPWLVHCRGGKDRTGLVVAIVHLLLGVALEDVFDDFLLTNRMVAQHRTRLLRTLRWFTLFRISEDELQPVLEARREHLAGALGLISHRGRSLEDFLIEAAAVPPAAIAALRYNLLE